MVKPTAWMIALLLLSAVAGCVEGDLSPGGSESGMNPSPEPSIGASLLDVNLTINDPRELFREGTQMQLRLISADDTPRVIAGVNLPEGIQLLSGNLSYDGPAPEEEPIYRTATVIAEEAGEYTFRAWGERPQWALDQKDGSRAAGEAWLGVEGDASTAHRTYASGNVDLAVDLVAEEDGRTWRLHIASPEITEVRLFLEVPSPPNGIRVVDGPVVWNGTLDEDEPRTFTYEVEYPSDGSFGVDATLHAHPSLSTDLYWDAFQVIVEGDDVTIRDTGPG